MGLQIPSHSNMENEFDYKDNITLTDILVTCIFAFFYEFKLISVLNKQHNSQNILEALYSSSESYSFQLELTSKAKAVLLLIDDGDALQESLVDISNLTVRPRLFVIKFIKSDRNESVDLLQFFNECIKLDVFFSAITEIPEVLLNEDHNLTSFDLNIFNPFEINQSNTRGKVHAYKIFNKTTAIDQSRRLLHDYVGFMKNFHGWKLVFRSYHDVMSAHPRWKGIEELFLDTVKISLNCSIEFQYRDVTFDAFYQNLGKMKQKLIDVLLNRYYMTGYGGEVTVVSPFNFDELCFITGEEPRVYQGDNLMRVFSPSVWMMIIATAALFIFLNRFTKLKIGRKVETIHFLQSMISISRINVEKIYHRVQWFSWIVFSFIISSAFSCSIVTMMTIPSYGQRMMTLEDVLKSGRKIFLYEYYQKSVWTNHSSIIEEIVKQSVPPGEDTPALFLSALNRESVVATASHTRDFFKLSLNQEGQRFYTISECLGSFIIGYLMRKKSIFFIPMRTLITNFEEHGFYEKWYRMAEHTVQLKPLTRKNSDDEFNYQLKFEDFKEVFIALIIGYSIGLLCFVIELQMPCVEKKVKHRRLKKLVNKNDMKLL